MDHDLPASVSARLNRAYLLIYKSLEEAEALVNDCLDDAEQAESIEDIINSKILLTLIETHRGNFDLARDRFRRIEEELGHAGSDDNLMRLAHLRGIYFMKEGVYKDSFDAFVRAGNLAARLGNEMIQALSANGKGSIKLDQQEFQEAFDYYRVGRTYLHGTDSSLLGVVFSLNMACALNGLDKDDEAISMLEEALASARTQDAFVTVCAVLDEIAGLYLKKGDRQKSREYLEEGMALSQNLSHEEIITDLVYHYVELLVEEGDFKKAESLLEEHGKVKEKDQNLAMYHQISAKIHEQKGDYKKAYESSIRVMELNKKIRGNNIIQSVYRQEKRELQEQNYRLSLVSTIGQELVANLDIGEILNLIYSQMNVLMPVDLLAVAILEGNDINVKFSINFGERIESFKVHKENPNSLMAWSLRNKKEVLIRDGREEYSKYVDEVMPFKGNHDNFLQSIICIPLSYINEVLGVLTVQSLQRNAYSSQDLDNLRALASYAGIAIRNALQTEKINEMNTLLKHQSSMDSLTGLVNRRELMRQARNVWKVCRRNEFWASHIMIDLDHFKDINDTHGHVIGDIVLKKLGDLLNDFFKRPLDCASRYGGEEMFVLVGNMTPQEAAARIELLREEFSAIDFESPKGAFRVNFSCGIYGEVSHSEGDEQITHYIDFADKCLYLAKENGRNCTYLQDNPQEPAAKFIFSHLK